MGTLSALMGFMVIGAGLWWVLPTADPSEFAARDTASTPLATPIRLTPERAAQLGLDAEAAGRVAVTHDAPSATSAALQVRLPDGSTAAARVIGSRAGISVIELSSTPSGDPYPITTMAPPSADTEVRVLSGDPYTTSFAQVNSADPSARPAAGTAVITLDGELLGFCVDHEDEDLAFISADELLESATEAAPSDPAQEP